MSNASQTLRACPIARCTTSSSPPRPDQTRRGQRGVLPSHQRHRPRQSYCQGSHGAARQRTQVACKHGLRIVGAGPRGGMSPLRGGAWVHGRGVRGKTMAFARKLARGANGLLSQVCVCLRVCLLLEVQCSLCRWLISLLCHGNDGLQRLRGKSRWGASPLSWGFCEEPPPPPPLPNCQGGARFDWQIIRSSQACIGETAETCVGVFFFNYPAFTLSALTCRDGQLCMQHLHFI